MAEGIAKAYAGPDSSVDIRSAGLFAIPGNIPSEYAVSTCLKHNIDIRGHRAHPVSYSLISWADFIFCMEHYQCLEIQRLFNTKTNVLLLGEGISGIPEEIIDPYGRSLEDYEQTFSYLTKAIEYHFGHFSERSGYDRKAKAS